MNFKFWRNKQEETTAGAAGRWLSLGLALLIPGALALYLFTFPVWVALDRDLQLHGIRTSGRVIGHKTSYTKGGEPIYNHRVCYEVKLERHCGWVKGASNSVAGGEIDIIYAPLLPSYAASATQKLDPWNQNLLGRSLAAVFVGLGGCGMVFGFVRRFRRKITSGG